MAGVGFACGDAVIEEVLKKFELWPKFKSASTKVMVTVFNESLYRESLNLANQFRSRKINTELYPDPEAKLDKQLKYADQKDIPYVVILGPDEIKNKTITLKNFKTGRQKTLSRENAIAKIKKTN